MCAVACDDALSRGGLFGGCGCTSRACSVVAATADVTLLRRAQLLLRGTRDLRDDAAISLRPPRIFLRAPAPLSASALLSSATRSPRSKRRPLMGDVLQRLDDAGDVGRGLGRAIGQIPDFLGHHRESPAGVTGAGRFDRCIERQQVRALGDQVDRVDDAADLIRALTHFTHHRRDCIIESRSRPMP